MQGHDQSSIDGGHKVAKQCKLSPELWNCHHDQVYTEYVNMKISRIWPPCKTS